MNDLLTKNLDVFFKRYPHERSRLSFPLAQPTGTRPKTQIELPPCPSYPPMRVLLLLGFGNVQFLVDLLNDATIAEETFQIFLIENDVEALRDLFQNWDLTQIIAHPKMNWCLLMNVESIKPALFSVLAREDVASMMNSVHSLKPDMPTTPEIQAFYAKVPDIYDETRHHVLHNFGRISDSLDGIKATILNSQVLLDCAGIEDLKLAFRGHAALIVGAGPSLDKELSTIKDNQDKFVIIAADAALKPLLKAGIRVDYVTSIERLNDYQKPFFEGLSKDTEVELVAYPVIHPDLFPLFPGKIRVCYRNYSYFAYFEKSWPKGMLKSGGSTAHLAIRLADYMGCSSIYLIGIDSCYEEKDGLYRSHCSGTGYPEWEEWVPLDTFEKKRRHLPPMDVEANDGSQVKTNITYYQWAKEYAGELADIGLRARIINCSTKGLKIEGIPYSCLVEVSGKLPLRDAPNQKPPYPTPHFLRSMNHKEIVKNFKAWLTLHEALIKECDALLSYPESEIVPLRFEALIFVYSFRVVVDPLFVSFVVQCCAKEFFDLENEWWACIRKWTMDLHKKIQNTKAKAELFLSVLKQLIQMFEEGENGREFYKSTDARVETDSGIETGT